MPTVKKEDESGDATPEGSTSSGPPAKTTRTVGTATDSHWASGPTRIKSEEDPVARRRERWRLNKREQRAKLAAKLSQTQQKVTPLITASADFFFRDADRRDGPTWSEPAETAGGPPTDGPGRGVPRRRYLKGKTRSAPSFNISLDAEDALEKVAAEQREYWRVKKRKQRANMSTEAKTRLREKNRVRRHRNIPDEARKARASEIIEGFIKEDGTLSAPAVRPSCRLARPRRPRECGRVAKMLIPDKTLTHEDHLAKKCEYWRVMKRQQKAGLARAARAPLFVRRRPTCGMEEEPEAPGGPPCPAPEAPPPAPKLEPAPVADFQASTLLAVTSMQKLLEESLSATAKREPDVETPIKEEPVAAAVAAHPAAVAAHPAPQPRRGAATSLQTKREYWKLMKRQQRARKRESRGEEGGASPPGSHQVSETSCRPRFSRRSRSVSIQQGPGLPAPSAEQRKTPAKILPKPAPSSGNAVPAVRPPSPDPGPPPRPEECSDSALPTLTPPDNPLSGIRLCPAEAAVGTAPGVGAAHSWATNVTGPPKRRPGESEEDFLRRKREYWRIKKKEQRARKAVREKGGDTFVTLRVQDFSPPLSGAWKHISHSSGAEVHAHAVAPLPGEENGVSGATWRNVYLMDYDPLHQLLVCMACGELQHSQSPEGALAHIHEAHPHTVGLEAAERRGILEAWDEQVSRRERFFTRQLRQGSNHQELSQSSRFGRTIISG
ncbi:uncharacterized protein LOC144066318 isoform X2 [Stigmatopora argus]